MPTSAHDTDPEQAELERLATELAPHGLHAELCTPPGKLPYLHVRNPQATVLNERIYAQAGAYWYSWAQKLTDTDDPADAAQTLARVLATTSGE
jgi:hypothetical protein